MSKFGILKEQLENLLDILKPLDDVFLEARLVDDVGVLQCLTLPIRVKSLELKELSIARRYRGRRRRANPWAKARSRGERFPI